MHDARLWSSRAGHLTLAECSRQGDQYQVPQVWQDRDKETEMIREYGIIEPAPHPEPHGTPVTLDGPVYRIRISPLSVAATEHRYITAYLKWPEPDGRVIATFVLDSLLGGSWTCPGPESPILGPVELSLTGGHGKFDFITNSLGRQELRRFTEG